MTEKAKGPQQLATAKGPKVSATNGLTASRFSQDRAPRVAGRVDTYKSRGRKHHRQIRVERCPGCGFAHLHRSPMALVATIVKTGPCGTEYVVVLRPKAVAA